MSSMMTTIKTPASNQKRDVRLLEHCRGSGPDILVPPKELLLANQVLSQSPVILIQPHNAPALRTRRKSTRAAVPVADAPTNTRQMRPERRKKNNCLDDRRCTERGDIDTQSPNPVTFYFRSHELPITNVRTNEHMLLSVSSKSMV